MPKSFALFSPISLFTNDTTGGKTIVMLAGECKLEQLISELVGKWKKKSSISAEPDASLRFMLMREKREKEKEKRSDVPLANVTNYYTETKTRCLLMT
jgi:hypothetical protein